MKDHQIAALVNELRDIAIEFHSTQQLRERISQAVTAALAQQTHKPLFAEMIAKHPGLAEELAQEDGTAKPASESDMAVYRGIAANYHKDRSALAQQDAQAVPVVWMGKMDFEALKSRGRVTATLYGEPVGNKTNEVGLCLATPTPPAQLPEARQWTGLTDIGVYFAITAAGKPPNPMSEEFFAWCEKFADAIEANLKERNA